MLVNTVELIRSGPGSLPVPNDCTIIAYFNTRSAGFKNERVFLRVSGLISLKLVICPVVYQGAVRGERMMLSDCGLRVN